MAQDRIRLGDNKNNVTITKNRNGLDVSATVLGYTVGKGPEGPYVGVSKKGVSARTKLAMPTAKGFRANFIQQQIHLPEALPIDEAKDRVQEKFRTFIANEGAVERLQVCILAALTNGTFKVDKNILMTGRPGCGKTELMKRTAKALGVPSILADGKAFKDRDKLLDHIRDLVGLQLESKEEGNRVFGVPPILIGIDEIHLMARPIQETLLTALDPNQNRIVLPEQNIIISTTNVTWMFATTMPSKLDIAFRDRCDEISLADYTEEEMADILQVKSELVGEWERNVLYELAKMGKLNPRSAITLAKDLKDYVQLSDRTPEGALEKIKVDRGISCVYLSPKEERYLNLLYHAPRNLGQASILNMLQEDVDKTFILRDVEPYLVRMGYVILGPEGRELTEKGKRIFEEDSAWRKKELKADSVEYCSENPEQMEIPGTSDYSPTEPNSP